MKLKNKYKEDYGKLEDRLESIQKELAAIEVKQEKLKDKKTLFNKYKHVDKLSVEVVNDFVDKIEGAEAFTFGGMVEAGMAVSNGNADASVMDILTAEIIVYNNPGLLLLSDSVESEETAIAVQKGNESLMNVINELLDELQANDQLQVWFDNHFEALLNE